MMSTEPIFSEVASAILRRRYLMKNERGEVVETPGQLLGRVAAHIASAEIKWGGSSTTWAGTFYEAMANRDFLPNTPCLVNAGRPGGNQQYSACFVLRIHDDMRSIFSTLRDAALIHKSGGGTGFSFSRIRPKGDFVRSSTGIASGPISFMEIYDAATEGVKQSGIRRGANMGILRVDHPDIREFIACKRDVDRMTNFNLSVAITDDFMEALKSGGDYSLINPRDMQESGRESARDIWELIATCAHATGEPGVFFIDTANNADPMAHNPDRVIEATNPCGEVPECAYNACTLGSINLGNFFSKEEETVVDLERLGATVDLAVRFLDDVLEKNQYPVPEIAKVTAATRKLGLGVMGWADLLIKAEIPYNSERARSLGETVMEFITKRARRASEDLAEERGPFLDWSRSRWREQGHKKRRNATVTVIAPTGSISILAGCSSGIEPLFALCQERRQADLVMTDMNPLFVEVAKREGFWSTSVEEHVKKYGSVRGCSEVPSKWREVFATANEIDPIGHLSVQSSFQRHTEDGVSKTINLSREASVEEVAHVYEAAWDWGCKGVTVYRDGSRPNQTLTAGIEKSEDMRRYTRRRIPSSKERAGKTLTAKTNYGSVHVTINEHPDDGIPFEVFINLGRAGSEVAAWAEALGRVISLLLSTSCDPEESLTQLMAQLSGIGGRAYSLGGELTASVPDAVAQCLFNYRGELEVRSRADLCPSCGDRTLVRAGGCDTCSCGYSSC